VDVASLTVSLATPLQLQMGQVDQSLVTFQSGLLGVEREMLPIYKLTEKLRETQRNIDVCVYELRRINENFVAAQTVRR
jgi:exocyst complex component 7